MVLWILGGDEMEYVNLKAEGWLVWVGRAGLAIGRKIESTRMVFRSWVGELAQALRAQNSQEQETEIVAVGIDGQTEILLRGGKPELEDGARLNPSMKGEESTGPRGTFLDAYPEIEERISQGLGAFD